MQRTVGDLVGLSPLLVDEDDGHEDNDLGDDAEERPQGGQAAAHAQLDFIIVCSQLICAVALVVAHVGVHVQVLHVQSGLVGGVLDFILIVCAVRDGNL